MSVGGRALLGTSVAYLAVTAIWRGPIAFGCYRLRPPSFNLASRKSRWPQSMPCWRVWLPADLGFFLGVYLIAATASELSLAASACSRPWLP
jgi:hypothetical protein